MTVFAPVMVIVHVAPDTLVHPVQLLNTELVSALAVSTTVAPFANVPVHGTPEITVQVNPGSANAVPPPPPVEFSVSGYVAGWKVAVTLLAAVIETVQRFPDADVQPLQLEKIDPASGAAVSVTVVAGDVFGTEAVQPAVEPLAQEMPAPVTVPIPLPDVFAVRSQVLGWNIAVAVFAAVIDTVQTLPDTLVHPLQPEKSDAASGVAVRVTEVAGEVRGTWAVHPSVEPVVQAMPSPVTVPAPAPDVLTVRRATAWNAAVTVFTASIDTVQTFPDTVAHPVQPAKAEVASGVAVSVTDVAGVVLGTDAVHPAVEPVVHEIPSPVTVPRPEPEVVTVSP